MFEIGSSLREARLRQGLDFPELEQATKIRGKYLRALEDEQFTLLPAETYVKGFLRSYAEYLGLDGQLYVDEFNSRYVVGEDQPAPRPRRSTQPSRRPRVQSRVVLLTLLGIALVTALVIVAWTRPGTDKQSIAGLESNQTATTAATKPSTTRTRPVQRAATVARLEVTATLDASWLQVHRSTSGGPIVYQGTLEKGERQVFVGRRLWIDVGRPEVLSVKLNGKLTRFPRGRPKVLVVTARGIRAVNGT
jgi:cytoskeleton protein RodZ